MRHLSKAALTAAFLLAGTTPALPAELKPLANGPGLQLAGNLNDDHGDHHGHHHHGGDGPIRADGHAPIGVMGDHMHGAGEWMISYRYMYMDMEGNQIGTDDVSPEEIVTTVPNRFFGNPGQPPTLRVVPTEMTMQMHMLGGMYAPTDWLTLMVMGMYIDKEMDHITFQGGMGTTRLGEFTTESSGLGDTKVSGLIALYDDGTHHFHLNAGLSLPTGSIDETDDILTPMGMRPTVRLPYPMQLGSGTFDALPGVTYTGRHSDFGWGAQWSSELRLGRNDEDYALGDKHQLTAWASYSPMPWISGSLRLTGMTQDEIDGIDTNIVAPVQTANTDFHGGDRLDLSLGLNLVGQKGVLRGHRIGLEVGMPVYQDLNGPQMETDFFLTIGYQYAF
ncbi:MAG: transporter [Alphaproteobacteria bacterium]|nr:transporter [Alphaproteobacteria bacterium SS10]